MVREHYRRMTDSELKHILTDDGAGLTPQARRIAREEAQHRGFDQDLLQSLDDQAMPEAEVMELCAIIQQLPCPHCGATDARLNATIAHETLSFLVVTRYTAKPFIACPACLDKRIMEANTMTALVGWWGIPWGLIRTPQSLYRNVRNKRQHRADGANETLTGFVQANAGRLKMYKSDPELLGRIVGMKA